jgi:hypothetical protein
MHGERQHFLKTQRKLEPLDSHHEELDLGGGLTAWKFVGHEDLAPCTRDEVNRLIELTVVVPDERRRHLDCVRVIESEHGGPQHD